MHKIKALCKCPQISYLPFCDVREKFRRVLHHSTGNCDEHICSHEELETAGWGLLFKTRQNKSKQTKPTCHGYLSKNHKGEEVSSLVTIKAIFPLILGITVNIQNHHPCPKQTLLCVLLTLQVQRPSRQLCQSKRSRSRRRPRCLKKTWAVTTCRWQISSSNTIIICRHPATSQVPMDLSPNPQLPVSPLVGGW